MSEKMEVTGVLVVKSLFVEYDDPHEAVRAFRERYPEAKVRGVTRLAIDTEQGCQPFLVDVEDWACVATCEVCGRAILTGDTYYAWADVETCKECGGATDTHKPLVA